LIERRLLAITDPMPAALPVTTRAAPAPAQPGVFAGLAGTHAQQLQAAASAAAGLLRGLANPERLMLLCALADGERCVSALAQATGIQQPTLSQQLGVLRDEGLVATRRDGKFIHYRVASAPAVDVLAVLYRHFCSPPDLDSTPP
jgi:DNA-binding transcriptional ArsR family regulator